jgi:hypothetical protein
MPPEDRVAAYISDCYQRKRRWNELQNLDGRFMQGWDEIEQLGSKIEAMHWTRNAKWPGASSCGWGSDEEMETECTRTFETMKLADGMVEVVVERRYGAQIKDKTVFRVRFEDDEWRIENEFEIGSKAPAWEHCQNPGVKHIRTAPRILHLGTICPSMDGLMKPSIRLHAVRDDTVTAFDSHMAGPFLANDQVTWPRCDCHQTPMLGGVQIWRRDLEARPFEVQGELFEDLFLPPGGTVGMEFPDGNDVLQVFWCPFDHPHEQSAHHLRWLDSSRVYTALARNPSYRQPPEFSGMVPMPCRLHPEWYPDYPSLEDALELTRWPDLHRELKAMLEQGTAGPASLDYDEYTSKQCINEFYSQNFGAIDGIKWSGYPCWIQSSEVPSCECGTPMQHLLTVASSCDPTIGSQPVIIDSIQPVQWDTELCMGDVGSVYYFICPKCPGGTQCKTVFQCS